MNKTLTISIGGQLFEIEENAYQQLDTYINSLKTYFKNDAEGEEIVSDIEARIAELFIEQQTADYKLIIKEQVEYVQLKMGTVKDFEPIEEIEDVVTNTSTHQQQTADFGKVPKKLMRDNEDRVLGGVSSGLAYYFNASPLLVRVLFLILFFAGPGIIIYFLFWIIVPKASTTGDKLLMKGLPVNVNTLADNIKTRNYSSNRLVDFVGQLITYASKFAILVAKLLLIVIGVSLLFGLMVAFGSAFFGFIMGGSPLNSFSLGTGIVFWFVKLMLLFSLAIPIVFIFVLMVYLLFNRNYFRSNYVLPLAGLWLLCTLGVGLYGKAVTTDFANENIVKQTTTIEHPNDDTLVIAVKESDHGFTRTINIFSFEKNTLLSYEDSLNLEEVTLLLETNSNSQLDLTVEKYAKGKTVAAAAERATLTNYNWQLNNDTLWLNNYVSIYETTKWRKQKVELFLAVPEGKVVHLANNTRSILTRRNENIQGIRGYNMNNRTWLMTANGFDCLDCDDDYEKIPQNIVGDNDNAIGAKKFEAIETEGLVKLNLMQGKRKIVVTDNEDMLEPFEYDVKNGLSVLQITTTDIDDDEIPALDIWTPNLQQLSLQGASSVNIENFELDEFELIAEGAHTITIDDIEVDFLKLRAEGACNFELDGTAKILELENEGLSKIDADKLRARDATLNIEGAAIGEFWVTENLEATIEGPARIKYKGNPKVEKNLSGFGSLKQIK